VLVWMCTDIREDFEAVYEEALEKNYIQKILKRQVKLSLYYDNQLWKTTKIPSSDIYDTIIEIKAVSIIMVACSWPII
jgi:hypothetical protein